MLYFDLIEYWFSGRQFARIEQYDFTIVCRIFGALYLFCNLFKWDKLTPIHMNDHIFLGERGEDIALVWTQCILCIEYSMVLSQYINIHFNICENDHFVWCSVLFNPIQEYFFKIYSNFYRTIFCFDFCLPVLFGSIDSGL